MHKNEAVQKEREKVIKGFPQKTRRVIHTADHGKDGQSVVVHKVIHIIHNFGV